MPERHQTLRSTIDWSYSLLQPFEHLTFQRLAAFVGGCDLGAAEDVDGPTPTASTHANLPAAGSPHHTLDVLAELLDNALLQRGVMSGERRFTMLETIREFALERLEASGPVAEARRRHAEYFALLAEEAESALSVVLVLGHWADRLERDHANLRAALGWLVDQDDSDIGLRLAAALIWFWWI